MAVSRSRGDLADGDFHPSTGAPKCTMRPELYQGRFALLTQLRSHGLKKGTPMLWPKNSLFLAREDEEVVSGVQRASVPSACFSYAAAGNASSAS